MLREEKREQRQRLGKGGLRGGGGGRNRAKTNMEKSGAGGEEEGHLEPPTEASGTRRSQGWKGSRSQSPVSRGGAEAGWTA